MEKQELRAALRAWLDEEYTKTQIEKAMEKQCGLRCRLEMEPSQLSVGGMELSLQGFICWTPQEASNVIWAYSVQRGFLLKVVSTAFRCWLDPNDLTVLADVLEKMRLPLRDWKPNEGERVQVLYHVRPGLAIMTNQEGLPQLHLGEKVLALADKPTDELIRWMRAVGALVAQRAGDVKVSAGVVQEQAAE